MEETEVDDRTEEIEPAPGTLLKNALAPEMDAAANRVACTTTRLVMVWSQRSALLVCFQKLKAASSPLSGRLGVWCVRPWYNTPWWAAAGVAAISRTRDGEREREIGRGVCSEGKQRETRSRSAGELTSLFSGANQRSTA